MKILILEDDKQLCDLIVSYLSQKLFVDYAHNVEDLKAYVDRYNYDAVLLDRNIDDEDVGLGLISYIKEKNQKTSVIVISAYGTVGDKIEGLNLGADDYLEKPYDNEELLARIYAQVRKNIVDVNINFENLNFNLINETITHDNKSIELSKKESNIIFYLLKNINKVVSAEELIDAVYLHPLDVSSTTIRVTIGNIRKKIPLNIIKTIKTRGYIIEN